MEVGDAGVLVADTVSSVGHRECVVATVLGGIGHFVDHSYWCENVGDQHMGLSLRESGRRVCELIDKGEIADVG